VLPGLAAIFRPIAARTHRVTPSLPGFQLRIRESDSLIPAQAPVLYAGQDSRNGLLLRIVAFVPSWLSYLGIRVSRC
jgi:hypothetical protein